ncbi:hypothetical protein PC117_g1702, partial [Phytophthora cactorum]
SLLLRFKSAAVQTIALDFDSIVGSDFSFHSSGSIISAITDAVSAEEINKKGDIYDTFTSNINDQLLSVANDYIDSKPKPSFGATCVEAIRTTTTTEDFEMSRRLQQHSFQKQSAMSRSGGSDVNRSTFQLSSTAAAAGFPMAEKKELTARLATIEKSR